MDFGKKFDQVSKQMCQGSHIFFSGKWSRSCEIISLNIELYLNLLKTSLEQVKHILPKGGFLMVMNPMVESVSKSQKNNNLPWINQWSWEVNVPFPRIPGFLSSMVSSQVGQGPRASFSIIPSLGPLTVRSRIISSISKVITPVTNLFLFHLSFIEVIPPYK